MYLPQTLFPLSLLAARSAHPQVEYTTETDRGPQYGSVHIINSCYYDVHVRSIGAWSQSQMHEGEKEYTIPARSSHNESYRESCPKSSYHNSIIPPPFCFLMDKLEGQGTSLKISKNKVGDGPENIFQLEYSLQQNPERGDDFPRLDYDISLLNCEQIENVTEVQVAADATLNFKKMNGCPGVQGGVALWFDDHTLCRPIYCNGQDYCDAIYNYQRTGEGEDSLACHAEYKGNMYLELCVGNGDGNARRRYDEWAATATSTAAHTWASQLQSVRLATTTTTTTTVTTATTVTTGLCPPGRYPICWYPTGAYPPLVYPPGDYPDYAPLPTHSPVLNTHPAELTTSCRTDLSVSDGIIRTVAVTCATVTTTGAYTTAGGDSNDIRCNPYGECWSYMAPGQWASATSTKTVTETISVAPTAATTSAAPTQTITVTSTSVSTRTQTTTTGGTTTETLAPSTTVTSTVSGSTATATSTTWTTATTTDTALTTSTVAESTAIATSTVLATSTDTALTTSTLLTMSTSTDLTTSTTLTTTTSTVAARVRRGKWPS